MREKGWKEPRLDWNSLLQFYNAESALKRPDFHFHNAGHTSLAPALSTGSGVGGWIYPGMCGRNTRILRRVNNNIYPQTLELLSRIRYLANFKTSR